VRLSLSADIGCVRLSRLPLTLRALVLVPLLAAGLDQVRASLVCGPGTRTCLEAAGESRIGLTGVLLLLLYAAGSALLVARLARGRSRLGLWAAGSAGLWAVCGGQALLASALGGTLGGGWLQLLLLAVIVGALLALALRTFPRALTWILSTQAPRPPLRRAAVSWLIPAAPGAPRLAYARSSRGRAPPVTA
jgi:hypothetical protein